MEPENGPLEKESQSGFGNRPFHRVVEIQHLGAPTSITTRHVRAKASAPLAFVEADDKVRSWPHNIVIEMNAMKIDRGP